MNAYDQHMPLGEVMALYDALFADAVPSDANVARLVTQIKNTPAIHAVLPVEKIEGIKRLRSHANCGLKEAKDAVDFYCEHLIK
jgi:ribosomal protein L7/L12